VQAIQEKLTRGLAGACAVRSREALFLLCVCADRVQRQQQQAQMSGEIDTVTPLVRRALGSKASVSRRAPTPMKSRAAANADDDNGDDDGNNSDDDDDADADDDDDDDDDEVNDDDDDDFAPTGVVAAVLASRKNSQHAKR
jgi:hypothetical protein